MFPSWNDGIRVPTVCDDVHIQHTITVQNPAWGEESGPITLSVQPRSSDGALSSRGRAIAELIRYTHRQTNEFLDRFSQGCEPAQSAVLDISTKHLLEDYRSVLEYTAHFLADFCSKKPGAAKVRFPIAATTDNEHSFQRRIEKTFPGLNAKLPSAVELLHSIQEFRGEHWLRHLGELSNAVKHRQLLSTTVAAFDSVVLGYGGAKIRLGELGFQSISVEDGGRLRLEDSPGDWVDILPPCKLTLAGIGSTKLDTKIKVEHTRAHLVSVPGMNISLPGLLWLIDKNVCRTVDSICSIASAK
jgi:hypothetical protein